MASTPNLDLEKECRNCLHRKNGWLCGNSRSSHFQQTVESEDSCQYFEPSLGQAYIIRALSTAMLMLNTKNFAEKEKLARDVIDSYNSAIKNGVPVENEIEAKFGIATTLGHIISRRMESAETLSALEDNQMGQLLGILKDIGASEKSNHVSQVARTWFQLAYVDLLLDLKAAVIGQNESRQASEDFVKEQLANFDHVIPTPLPKTLLRWGKYSLEKGQNEQAAKYLLNVRESLSRREASFLPLIQQLKQDVEASYRAATGGQNDVSSVQRSVNRGTRKAAKSGCFIATAVYGSEIAPDVIALSSFRDNILSKFKTGRIFIKFYYRISPFFAGLIARSNFLRRITRLVIIQPISFLVKRIQWEPRGSAKNHAE